uniref:ZNF380 coiled-coil domain-containing protein n=1 Tax=Phlebotomus papatasi TaxID=29031 RepID=A0A1B0DQ59_PHLPP
MILIFFNDPVKYAKSGNHQKYKDLVKEEWENFQCAIREATKQVFNAIIAENQEESTAEKQSDEIEEHVKEFIKRVKSSGA